MNTVRRVATNFLSLATSELISKILQLVIFVYLARVLGKNDFGIFSFAIAFSLLVVIIADFGLSTLLIREISRNKKLASKYITNALAVKFLLSFFTLFTAYIFLNAMNYGKEIKLVAYIMLSFTLLQSFTDLYYSIFRAFEKMHYGAFIKVLRMLILVALVFYVIKSGFGLVASSMMFVMTETFVLIAAIVIVYTRFIKISFDFDAKFSKLILKTSFLFFLSLIFTNLFMFADSIIISKMISTTEVGIYAAAANIMLAAVSIPMVYGTSIYPVISRLHITSKKSLKFAYERSFKYMLIIGLPVSAGIFILSQNIILFLYGVEYASSSIVLSILCWYLFLRFINIISGFTLTSINRQGSRVFGQGVGAVSSIILNLALIPLYGIKGAAIAAIVTEIIFFFIYTAFIIRYGYGINFIGIFVKPAIAVSLMLITIFLIENTFIAIAIGFFVYLASLLFFGIIDKEDKIILNKILKDA